MLGRTARISFASADALMSGETSSPKVSLSNHAQTAGAPVPAGPPLTQAASPPSLPGLVSHA